MVIIFVGQLDDWVLCEVYRGKEESDKNPTKT
jgi:hypothetical protein